MPGLELILAIFIGLTLGLTGGGGSILAVPILVYVAGINPGLSTAYSLFVVGATALIGAYDYYKKKLLNYKIGFAFALPSFIVVFITRKYLIPIIPDQLLSIDHYILTKSILIMLVFAILMLLASLTMIRQKVYIKSIISEEGKGIDYAHITLQGSIVGLLTGIAGAGGGFLIIPALVLFAGLPMKNAVGTSLLIIAINSLIGFIGDLASGVCIDWRFLIGFSSFAFSGIFIGSYISNYIDSNKLKPLFGWFTLIISIAIIIKELFIN